MARQRLSRSCEALPLAEDKYPVIDRPPHSDPPPYWTQSAPAARWQDQNASALRRFIGGSPLAVAAKLVIVSFIVGALLMWLHISPADVFQEIVDLFDRLYLLGFRSIRDFGTYLFAGAVIVLPVWLIIRLLSFKGR